MNIFGGSIDREKEIRKGRAVKYSPAFSCQLLKYFYIWVRTPNLPYAESLKVHGALNSYQHKEASSWKTFDKICYSADYTHCFSKNKEDLYVLYAPWNYFRIKI